MKSSTTVSRSVKRCLRFVGVWPGIPWSGIYKFIWVTTLLIIQVYEYKYIITYYKTISLEDMIDTLSLTAAFGLTFFKLIIAWKHHDVLRCLLFTMEEDCQKYAIIDTNNLISKKGHLSYRLTSIIIFLYSLSGALYGIGFIFQPTNHSMPRELLLKMDLPFNFRESPIYEVVVTLQFLHQLLSATTFGVFSALLLMVILHVGCQVDIMCHALLNSASERKIQLRFFITRHQEIILFTQKIEKFFTYIALNQLLSNTVITCCLGFLMVVVSNVLNSFYVLYSRQKKAHRRRKRIRLSNRKRGPSSGSIGSENGLAIFIKSFVFYVVTCFEAFIYCFAGEYLNIKSELIGYTAYELLWYDLHPNESRLLIILIKRSQKGFKLTFGKFSNLSLECFTSIMKASVSYVSMLLAMT